VAGGFLDSARSLLLLRASDLFRPEMSHSVKLRVSNTTAMMKRFSPMP
jgi:hypothetical protein